MIDYDWRMETRVLCDAAMDIGGYAEVEPKLVEARVFEAQQNVCPFFMGGDWPLPLSKKPSEFPSLNALVLKLVEDFHIHLIPFGHLSALYVSPTLRAHLADMALRWALYGGVPLGMETEGGRVITTFLGIPLRVALEDKAEQDFGSYVYRTEFVWQVLWAGVPVRVGARLTNIAIDAPAPQSKDELAQCPLPPKAAPKRKPTPYRAPQRRLDGR